MQNKTIIFPAFIFAVIALMCLPLLAMMGPAGGVAVRAFSSPSSWLFLAILVGPCTLLAFLWMNHWQPHVSATTAGLIYCLEPVFTSVFALFLPGMFSALAGVAYANETMTSTLIIGGGLILTANVLMVRGAKPETTLNEHGV